MTELATPVTRSTADLGPRISSADPIYAEVTDFLVEEADLLDTDRQIEWLENVTDDIAYTMPVRKTVHRIDGEGIDHRGGNFYDDRAALAKRVHRNVVIEGAAYDRDPPPRMRRLVTNVSVYEAEGNDEWRVKSYFVFYRNQFDLGGYDMMTGERQDVLRRVDGKLKLARRVVLIDVSTLGAAFPNVII
jgi:3-phenylpropionate/cinnamic acid dioxygenase small subunit